jgi:hypothetical protein
VQLLRPELASVHRTLLQQRWCTTWVLPMAPRQQAVLYSAACLSSSLASRGLSLQQQHTKVLIRNAIHHCPWGQCCTLVHTAVSGDVRKNEERMANRDPVYPHL